METSKGMFQLAMGLQGLRNQQVVVIWPVLKASITQQGNKIQQILLRISFMIPGIILM